MTMKTKTKKKAAPRKKRSAAPKSGLSGYLVIWRHTMDDVPLGLFEKKTAALKMARTISRRKAYQLSHHLGIDCSTPVCFVVAEFENGAPQDMIYSSRDDDA
jgi:hypothetical protein